MSENLSFPVHRDACRMHVGLCKDTDVVEQLEMCFISNCIML